MTTLKNLLTTTYLQHTKFRQLEKIKEAIEDENYCFVEKEIIGGDYELVVFLKDIEDTLKQKLKNILNPYLKDDFDEIIKVADEIMFFN